jgi:uncharacterized protein (TIGR02246 family)
MEADVRAIKDALDRWVQLYNAGQYDTIVSTLYADDAVLMTPNAPIREGREAILQAYSGDAEVNDEHIDTSVVEDLRVSGDLAVARGADTGTTTPKRGGSPAKYSLKWLMVLQRQADGAWNFIYEMWNDDSTPQEGPE